MLPDSQTSFILFEPWNIPNQVKQLPDISSYGFYGSLRSCWVVQNKLRTIYPFGNITLCCMLYIVL